MSKIKIKISDLRNVVQEFKKTGKVDLPKEDKLISPKKAKPTKLDVPEKEKEKKVKLDEAVSFKQSEWSLDLAIDSLILGFEEDSLPGGDDPQTSYEEALNPFDKYMDIILEQEGNEDEKENEKPPKEPKYTDKEDVSPEFRAEPMKPKIDIGKFSAKVARLILNYQNLLDPKTIIYNRAKKFLEANYDFATATKYEEEMEQNHDISLEPEYGEKHFKSRPIAPGAAGNLVGGGGGL